MEITKRKQGRIAPGSVYQCYHGDKWVPHIILEWQVFERIITRESNTLFPGLTALVEYQLVDVENGTRLIKSFARPKGSFFGVLFINLLMPIFKRFSRRALVSFKDEIEQDYYSDKNTNQKNRKFAPQELDPLLDLDI
jgi:hypothetical protein